MNRLLLLKAAAVNAPILNHYNIPFPPLAFIQRDNQTVSRLTSMLSLPPLAVSAKRCAANSGSSQSRSHICISRAAH